MFLYLGSEYFWRYYKKSKEHRLYDKSLRPSDTGWTIKKDASGKYVVTNDLGLRAFGGIPLSKSKKKFSTLEKAKEYCVNLEMR